MARRTTHPSTSRDALTTSGQPSGSFVYGAGHRAVRETVRGREYYESGGLSREWIATRERLEFDPRLLPRAPSRWVSRTLRRIWRLVRDVTIAYFLLAVGVGATWAGWSLGGFQGACIGMGAVALLLALVDHATSGS